MKQEDANHPATHSNWPPSAHLDLSYLDFLSFNVYPLWPPEVVARGYGNYIKDVLQPIAGEKPLLITEFGANTIEALEDGQSRLLKQSWEELSSANTAGSWHSSLRISGGRTTTTREVTATGGFAFRQRTMKRRLTGIRKRLTVWSQRSASRNWLLKQFRKCMRHAKRLGSPPEYGSSPPSCCCSQPVRGSG